MEIDELKQWLRDNLVIETSTRGLDYGNSVYVQLRFKGERDAFSETLIHIPDNFSEG